MESEYSNKESFQQILLTTFAKLHLLRKVKAIRTAGSTADWRHFVALLIELEAQIL